MSAELAVPFVTVSMMARAWMAKVFLELATNGEPGLFVNCLNVPTIVRTALKCVVAYCLQLLCLSWMSCQNDAKLLNVPKL